MSSTLRKLLQLEGLLSELSCSRIEDEIGKLPFISNVLINPLTSRAIIELREEVQDKVLLNELNKAIIKVEDNIKVKEISRSTFYNESTEKDDNILDETVNIDENYENNPIDNSNNKNYLRKQRKIEVIPFRNWLDNKIIILNLITFVLSVICFFMAIFGKKENLNILFMLSYVLISWNLLVFGLISMAKNKILDENIFIFIATLGIFFLGFKIEAICVLYVYFFKNYCEGFLIKNIKKSFVNHFDNVLNLNVFIEEDHLVPSNYQSIKVGDTVLVRPNETILFDGVVTKGASKIDESLITGDLELRTIKERDKIFAGSINKIEDIEIKVIKTINDSMFFKFVNSTKASLEATIENNYIKNYLNDFGIFILVLSLMFISFPYISHIEEITLWVYRGFLIMILISQSYLSKYTTLLICKAIMRAHKNGIRINNANPFFILNKLGVAIFEKTNTLTDGNIEVSKIVPFGYTSEEMMLEYATYAELFSNHSIAKCIISAFRRRSPNSIIDKSRIRSFEEFPGKGVRIYLGDRYIYVGNYKLMNQFDINSANASEIGTIIHVAINQNYAGYMVISDKIKASAPKAVNDLKNLGVKRIAMLTGDNKAVSEYVGKILNIEEIYTELLPEEKNTIIKTIAQTTKRNKNIAFISYGSNNTYIEDLVDISIGIGGYYLDDDSYGESTLVMSSDLNKVTEIINISKKLKKSLIKSFILVSVFKIIVICFSVIVGINMIKVMGLEFLISMIILIAASKSIKID
jgi:Cd2+/Zn2+-exporting ATPase